MPQEPQETTKKGEKGPWDFASYDDVPEEWKRHWQDVCGYPPGVFPPGIDDSDFFAMVDVSPEAEEEEE